MNVIPFQSIDWTQVEKTEHKGEAGTSFWQTLQMDGIRVRLVEYSAGYLADHWCEKGHIVHCLSGEFLNTLSTGEQTIMKTGMTFIVSDELSSHRSFSEKGALLLVIDGNFLAVN